MSVSKDILEMIKYQTEDFELEDVEELTLDQTAIKFTTEFNELLQKYENLASLSLNDCKITSLENFPNLNNIQRLELIDNKITGPQLKHLSKLTQLQSLSLGGNLIKTFEDIEILKDFPQIFQLDLINNEISELPEYRDKLFNMLPKLTILDNIDKEGNEIDYGDEDDEDEPNSKELDDEDAEELSDEEDFEEQGGDDEDDDEFDEDDEEDVEPAVQKKVKKN